MFEIQITKIQSTKHTNDGTFLQTPFWCQFKTRHGWTYRRFEIEYTLQPLNTSDKECADGQIVIINRKDGIYIKCSDGLLKVLRLQLP